MKFLVLWRLEIQLLSAGMMQGLLRQQDHFAQLSETGKLTDRYHIPGQHGGALIFDVDSVEELDHLLAAFPVYNVAHFDVYPLAEMQDPTQLSSRGEQS